MIPPDLDLAHRCQRTLDIAAATRREAEARQALPQIARDFGHDSFSMLRASDEHAYAIMQRGK